MPYKKLAGARGSCNILEPLLLCEARCNSLTAVLSASRLFFVHIFTGKIIATGVDTSLRRRKHCRKGRCAAHQRHD